MCKSKIGYVCCIALFLLFAGCGQEELNGNILQNSSEITETPEQTEATEKADVPENTDLTGTPEMPELSDEPEKTDKPQHRVEMELVEYTYPFYELWCAANAEPTYVTTDDGACRVVFSRKYNKLIFALPEGINMALCDHVTVKARSEYGRFGVELYDEVVFIEPWDMSVYAAYDLGGEGIQDYMFYPDITCDVWGVGIAAMDEVEDFSKYVVDVYSVTFHMKPDYVQ